MENFDKDDSEREEILYRYFQDDLSEDEKSSVEAWRDLSAENRQLFEEAKVFSLDLKAIAYYQNLGSENTEASWDRFKKEHDIIPINTPTKTQTFSFVQIAASVVLVITAAWTSYSYFTQPKVVAFASTDGVEEILLSEGTKVELNKGAKITYMDRFEGEERRVSLAGEAYFDVTKADGLPFVVEANKAEVRVLGTKFLISQPDEEQVAVSVDEGKVLFSYQDLHQIISEGETFTINLEEAKLQEMVDETGVTTFWKTRKLVFNETPLSDVVSIVNQAYGTSLILSGSPHGCELTVTFDNENIDNVLEIISSTLNLQITEENDDYLLEAQGCQ